MRVSVEVSSPLSRSIRARQVEALFDVPAQERATLRWEGDVALDRPWNVGLIVGPSGAGKTTVARALFDGHFHPDLSWGAPSVIEDVAPGLPIADVTAAFSSVGFNTVPAWLRPFSVLSNGEKFRVEVARRLLELPSPVVVDEFTSVVDRQVAQVGSHAVQKFVRARGSQFVAVSCHSDIIDWLQPDWVLEPATMTLTWRVLQRRPTLAVTVAEVGHDAWPIFAPYHYMSADLNRAARCFVAFVGETPAAFAGILHLPHASVKNMKRVSRLVTLPDFQGLGLAFVLTDLLGGLYRSHGLRLRMYPAHPSLVRSYARSPAWVAVKAPSPIRTELRPGRAGGYQARPCAVFEYTGPVVRDASFTARTGA